MLRHHGTLRSYLMATDLIDEPTYPVPALSREEVDGTVTEQQHSTHAVHNGDDLEVPALNHTVRDGNED